MDSTNRLQRGRASGFRPVTTPRWTPGLQRLPLARALALVDLIATLHAGFWGSPDVRSAEWLPSVSTVKRGIDWLRSRRELFLQRFGDRLDDTARRLLANIDLVAARANERLSGAEVTLLHADLHLDNVVFEGVTGRPVLLDWARVSKGPGALDLAEMLFSIGQSGDRESLLDAYLGGLRRRGVTGCDEISLRHQLGGGLLRKFIASTCGVARWQPVSAREMAVIEVGLERIIPAVSDWRQHDPDLLRF